MLKLTATQRDGTPLVLFGLSRMNIDRLVAGEPISFELAEVDLGPGTLVIWAGSTEQAMADELQDMIRPQTRVERR